MYNKDNVVTLPGSGRPKIDYTVGANGRIDPTQYQTALTYLREMNKLCQGTNQKLVKVAQTEAFAFINTLPKADREEALETIVAESVTIRF